MGGGTEIEEISGSASINRNNGFGQLMTWTPKKTGMALLFLTLSISGDSIDYPDLRVDSDSGGNNNKLLGTMKTNGNNSTIIGFLNDNVAGTSRKFMAWCKGGSDGSRTYTLKGIVIYV